MLVVVLALFGPLPLSLCATMAGLPADCEPTPHCEMMAIEQPAVALTAPVEDCCQLSSAPLLEGQVKAPAPAASLELVAVPALGAQVVEAETPVANLPARPAPLDLQAALCVFLI